MTNNNNNNNTPRHIAAPHSFSSRTQNAHEREIIERGERIMLEGAIVGRACDEFFKSRGMEEDDTIESPIWDNDLINSCFK